MPRPAWRGGKRRAAGGSTDLVKWEYGNPACQPPWLHTRYYLVWAPKYRKWVLQGAVREGVQELFLEIAEHHRFEIEELEVEKDDVHVFLSFPTKYSTGQVVGLLKAVSAREIRAGSVTDLQHAG